VQVTEDQAIKLAIRACSRLAPFGKLKEALATFGRLGYFIAHRWGLPFARLKRRGG
jgi:hypothetical protein